MTPSEKPSENNDRHDGSPTDNNNSLNQHCIPNIDDSPTRNAESSINQKKNAVSSLPSDLLLNVIIKPGLQKLFECDSEPSKEDSETLEHALNIEYDATHIINILCCTLEKGVLTTAEINEWLTFLSKKLAEKTLVFKYSYITTWIYEFYIDLDSTSFARKMDTIISNIDHIVDAALSQKTEIHSSEVEQLTIKYVLKLQDHITLANQQCSLFDKVSNNLKKEMTANLEKAEKQAKANVETTLQSATKDIYSQLIGLVGIFTALSFIIFGGLISMDSLVQALGLATTDSVLPLILLAIIWCFCIMNLLYVFMYFVLRISKHDAHLLNDTTNYKKNFIQQHPVVCLTNFILFSLLLICSSFLFAKKYGIGQKIFCWIVYEHPNSTFVIGLIVICAVLWYIGKKLKDLYKTGSNSNTSRNT